MKFPNKKYNIIYCDPPYAYSDKALAGNRGACCKYLVQSQEWLKALPVRDLAADNCAIFLWCTAPKLNEVFEIITAWNFCYKTVAFTWIKKNKKKDSLFTGMGRYTRANAEYCLLAIKGHMKRLSASVHSVIQTPIERHSQKPAIVRDKIVELFGPLPRIELFARERVSGWDSWGNEI